MAPVPQQTENCPSIGEIGDGLPETLMSAYPIPLFSASDTLDQRCHYRGGVPLNSVMGGRTDGLRELLPTSFDPRLRSRVKLELGGKHPWVHTRTRRRSTGGGI